MITMNGASGTARDQIQRRSTHESLDSTNKYLHADMELKRRALDRTTPTSAKPGRYRAPDRLLAFLESL